MPEVIITPDYQQRHPNPPMPVYRDYEITIDFTPIFNQAYAIIKEYVTKSGTDLPSENVNNLDNMVHYK